MPWTWAPPCPPTSWGPACLPACLTSLVETLSGPLGARTSSPSFPSEGRKRHGTLTGTLEPWVPTFVPKPLPPEGAGVCQGTEPHPLSHRSAPRQGPCVLLGAQPSPAGPWPPAALLKLGGARPPPQSERDCLKLQAGEHALPWELCLPLLPVCPLPRALPAHHPWVLVGPPCTSVQRAAPGCAGSP